MLTKTLKSIQELYAHVGLYRSYEITLKPKANNRLKRKVMDQHEMYIT